MTKGFLYDGHLFYADLSLVSLESRYRLFTKDSYEEIVEPEDIFHAKSFRLILEDYIESLINQDAELYDFFARGLSDPIRGLTSLTSLFSNVTRTNVIKDYPQYESVLSDGGLNFMRFIEGFLSFYLSRERFGFLKAGPGMDFDRLKLKLRTFRATLLHLFHKVETNVLEKPISVESELNVGFSCGLLVDDSPIRFEGNYAYLNDVLFVKDAYLALPYTTSTKKNKRIGVYQPSPTPLAKELDIDPSEFLCIPIYCGSSLVYFYFNVHNLNNVIGILNLFTKVPYAELEGKKPDIIVIFGGNKGESTGTYYYDGDGDFLVGYVSETEDADYFGYVKKLILTLHNTRMINQGYLPIHGSMMDIIMKSGKEVKIIIMGDSGAGKSESIEAFRKLAKEYLKDIKIIFDDMGTLFLTKDGVRASGTESGAFVRIDDLDIGYAFSHINDSIIYNADRTNARIVYHVTPYDEVVTKWPIDIFLYANNYEKSEEGIRFPDSWEEVAAICEEGKRMAKGTTGEVGIVSSYFANPFGPVQNKEKTQELVKEYFAAMAKDGTSLGIIYTQLGLENMSKIGPELAAKKLFEWINQSEEKK